jgi:hypothetical protein
MMKMTMTMMAITSFGFIVAVVSPAQRTLFPLSWRRGPQRWTRVCDGRSYYAWNDSIRSGPFSAAPRWF